MSFNPFVGVTVGQSRGSPTWLNFVDPDLTAGPPVRKEPGLMMVTLDSERLHLFRQSFGDAFQGHAARLMGAPYGGVVSNRPEKAGPAEADRMTR